METGRFEVKANLSRQKRRAVAYPLQEFDRAAEAIAYAEQVAGRYKSVVVEKMNFFGRGRIIWADWFQAPGMCIDIPERDFDYTYWEQQEAWKSWRSRRNAGKQNQKNIDRITAAEVAGKKIYWDGSHYRGITNYDVLEEIWVDGLYGKHKAYRAKCRHKIYWDQTISDTFEERIQAQRQTEANRQAAIEKGERFYRALAPMNPTDRKTITWLWADRQAPGKYFREVGCGFLNETLLYCNGFGYEWDKTLCGTKYSLTHDNKM